MGIFVDNCATIARRLGCAVIALHHCGKDTGRGARGSSALRAAADCEILVEGTAERRTATVTKSKDGEDGWRLEFRLTRVEIETADDRELSSCILEVLKDWTLDTARPEPKRKLSDRQRLALDCLADLAIDGKPLPAEWQMPTSIKAVDVFTWKAELERRGVLDREGSNPRARWQELNTGLLARKAIGERDGLVWKVRWCAPSAPSWRTYTPGSPLYVVRPRTIRIVFVHRTGRMAVV